MSDNYLDEKAIRERVEKRLSRFKRYFAHLVLTIVACLALTLAIEQAGLSRNFEPIIPVLVLLFIAHSMWLGYREVGNFIVQQEIERERHHADTGIEEKLKRGKTLVLGDDGELEEIAETPEWRHERESS